MWILNQILGSSLVYYVEREREREREREYTRVFAGGRRDAWRQDEENETGARERKGRKDIE